jgi:hypothetical protein
METTITILPLYTINIEITEVDASLFIIRSVETARPESTVVAASEKME